MKKLLLILLLVAGSVLAQGRPFKIINVEVDSVEVVELKKLFNSLVVELHRQLSNQGRFAPGRINEKTATFDGQIASLERLRDALTHEDLLSDLQKQIEVVEALRDELTGIEEGGRKDKSDKAPAIIAKLNQQLNDIERALRALD